MNSGEYRKDCLRGRAVLNKKKREEKDAKARLTLRELEESGLPFKARQQSLVMIERLDGGIIDLLLTTGKWLDRTTKRQGRSIDALLEYLRDEDQLDE